LVLTEELTYPGLKAAAETLGLKLMGLAMDDQGLRPGALNKACQATKASILYCIPDLQNPTSSVMPLKRRKQIARIAQTNGLAIIEDALHRPLLSDPPPVLAELSPANTYLLASVAKTLAGGLRVGFLKGPPETYCALVQKLQSINLTAPPLPVEVMAIWLEDGTINQILHKRRAEAEIRQGLLAQYLGGFKLMTHQRSNYVLLVLPERWSSLQFATEAFKQGVVVAPEETFAINGGSQGNTVRISLSTPQGRDMLEKGLRILADILAGVGGDLTPKI
ncbi:MAG: PLP-dependent aminotransferase family protein, partial [Desulfarculaceae bacterium]